MEKFQNKYRIPSARLKNWDYGANGSYFITICTHKMQCFFGNVSTRFITSAHDSETASTHDSATASAHNEDLEYYMNLNSLGEIAHNIWAEIPKEFSFIELGVFQIMPNHIHGILIIDKSFSAPTVETRLIASVQDPPSIAPAPPSIAPAPPSIAPQKGGICGDKNPMFHENISRAIRWYKGRCSFELHNINKGFKWHPRFHDHIIRNAAEFERIQNYIEQNPAKWAADKYYK
ncbi:transposase [Flavobacterium sp. TAB 87]|uniref:transposase n=1 Tax=Flavobacterium sp. TAB 87 TaxID=1729581 RepID=UPI00076BE476|nr:transposase [Flavobacterium sp. TAB 87]KVV16190.1 Transposase [Flavobacterium sp. TAB 87]